jgi:thiol:disulfide interchange protein/DsbC/DsbD-like thiol-disulfide interchange protein
MRLLAWLLMLAALLGSVAAHAQAQPNMEIHVRAGLEAETLRPAPGSTVTLAITMQPDAGWHGYWSNPGDAGEGLTLDWNLPAGVTTSAPRFPVPETLIISGFMNYVYERPHAVLVDVTVPANAAVGTKLPVSADAYWLACTDKICVPQQGTLSLELEIGDGKIAASDRTRFDAWRAALPVPLDRESLFAVTGKTVEIAIPYPAKADVAQPYFFPLVSGQLDHMAAQKLRRNGDWLIVETQLSGDPPVAIEGLVRIGAEQGLLIKAKPGKVAAGGTAITGPAKAKEGPQTPALIWLLLGALAGGVLLNIMPCVFPILGLKALALAKAGGDEREAQTDALAYTSGVVISCLALGGIMLALRAAGQEVGWAFQLQEPGFVLFLLLLMTAITANLFGLFELGGFQVGDALTRKPGLIGSFWTGALAAIVATPCTGPFMAAALGAALLLPTVLALLLFAALGLGISLPFLLIAYAPALRNRLPKPGPWLMTFRKVMAVPMGLTALALIWLLGRLTGPGGYWATIGAILAMFAMLWVDRHSHLKFRNAAIVRIGAVILIFGVTLRWLPSGEDIQIRDASLLPSEAFSEERLLSLRKQSQPVFVYFTADWCVTCKVNEAAVLERAETATFFKGKGIAVLRGDFTRRDPAITRFLAQQGAVGIPLYLYYPKGGEAQKLPQILSQAILKDTIK